ncbi:UNVERIFIED_CONTAM: hypothetical protein GTU68_045450 [Idotea baltica]|nr:hypothetical protein [Idotea baltica]
MLTGAAHAKPCSQLWKN